MKNEAFSVIKCDDSWSFNDLTRQQTNYASHGYHKYPAKFIPQIVRRLLNDYSEAGDTVLDCFGGCGTTLVESKLNGRNSIVLDVNEAALLITKAKKEAIDPYKLGKENEIIVTKLNQIKIKKDYYLMAHPRLKYWFKKKEYNQLAEIYKIINRVDNSKIKRFYQCCFSNILKNCSIWYSKSIKPMKDPYKKIANPVQSFLLHLKFMTKQNMEYYELLKRLNNKPSSEVLERDARNTGLESNSVDLIVTSPPYATSYEYADLHQLTLLWFGFTNDMMKTKRKFIGTSVNSNMNKLTDSQLANKIVRSLKNRDKHLAGQINNYYIDMHDTFREMYRVLRPGRMTCIIIGDTQYKNVRIKNMEVSKELLESAGFKIKKIIKRKLSSKIFTPYRDKDGKFTDSNHGKKRKIYQYEYIIVARK